MLKVEIITKRKLTIYGFRKTHRWRVTAANGKIIGASTEWYYNTKDCLDNLKSLAAIADKDTIPIHMVNG